MDRPRRRPRVRDQGHLRGDDALFSSRRASITADLRGRAARFEQRYGRAPSQRELAQLAQASNFATRAAKEGALDFAQLHAGWADKLARTLGVALASVAPSVWHGRAATRARALPGARRPVLSRAGAGQAAQKAVALAQQEKSAWTRADLVKYLGRVCPAPAGTRPRPPPCSKTWLTGRCASEFEPVGCLEAPEPAEVPPACCARTGAASTSGTAVPVCDVRAAGHGRTHGRTRRRGRRAARDPRARLRARAWR